MRTWRLEGVGYKHRVGDVTESHCFCGYPPCASFGSIKPYPEFLDMHTLSLPFMHVHIHSHTFTDEFRAIDVAT